jgi:HAD superfamily hydrolase (TIGR01509 family)
MIKLLIFDAGDLLWKNSPKILERYMNKFFKKYNIDGNIISRRWNKIRHKVETGKIKYNKSVEIEFKGLNISKKGLKEWIDIHTKDESESKKLNPYVRSIIKTLRRRYKVAILSDEVRGYKHKILICKRLGINVFDKVFCSSDIGYKKPHKKAFFTVLNYFNVNPSEAVFIGHSKDEIEGARKYNIKTIAIRWDRGTKSDSYIKRFSDIPKVLERI